MKRTILGMLILVLTLSLVFGVVTVSAEETPLTPGDLIRIDALSTFSDPNNNILVNGLTLPTNYWVKYVAPLGTSGHKVEYNGVELYIEDTMLRNMTKFEADKYKPVTKPMFEHSPIHVSQDVGVQLLYTTKDCTEKLPNNSLTESDIPLTFLNSVTGGNDELVYLVAKDANIIGYIKAQFTDSPDIRVPAAPILEEKPQPTPPPDTNPDTDTPITPDEGEGVLPNTGTGEIEGGVLPDKNDKNEAPTNNVVKVTLIVAICVLAVILVFLIFKPTRKNKGKYDVDDYDDYDRDDAYQDRY